MPLPALTRSSTLLFETFGLHLQFMLLLALLGCERDDANNGAAQDGARDTD